MTPPPAEPASHRERKKARTRAALIEVSQRLFAEQGYGATTLEDISAEVDVRPQTLLRYFESKAALALAPLTGALDELRHYLDLYGKQGEGRSKQLELAIARSEQMIAELRERRAALDRTLDELELIRRVSRERLPELQGAKQRDA